MVGHGPLEPRILVRFQVRQPASKTPPFLLGGVLLAGQLPKLDCDTGLSGHLANTQEKKYGDYQGNKFHQDSLAELGYRI